MDIIHTDDQTTLLTCCFNVKLIIWLFLRILTATQYYSHIHDNIMADMGMREHDEESTNNVSSTSRKRFKHA